MEVEGKDRYNKNLLECMEIHLGLLKIFHRSYNICLKSFRSSGEWMLIGQMQMLLNGTCWV